MLKSCATCGKIHNTKERCPKKQTQFKVTVADKFRWSRPWKKKRDQIKHRDKYLCQVCLRNLYKTIHIYNFNELEVHHIDSILDNWNKRLDDDNLITICEYHHTLAEKGLISKKELFDIVQEQEARQ